MDSHRYTHLPECIAPSKTSKQLLQEPSERRGTQINWQLKYFFNSGLYGQKICLKLPFSTKLKSSPDLVSTQN